MGFEEGQTESLIALGRTRGTRSMLSGGVSLLLLRGGSLGGSRSRINADRILRITGRRS